MQVFVCYPVKLAKSSEFKNLESICKQISHKTVYANLKLHIKPIVEKTLEKNILSYVKKKIPQTETIPKLLEYCVEATTDVFYHLSRRQFKVLAFESTTLEHIDRMIQLFEFYFPQRQTNLLSIPHFNQIEDHMLYAYTEEGELGSFCDYAGYLGEVRLFSEKLLASIQNPTGILLKNFTNDCLKTVLDHEHLIPQQFEIDWLYLGSKEIVVFEVGMSENPDQPKAAICNKLNQTLQTIIPQMQMILYSFWISYRKPETLEENSRFFDSVQNLFKVVIYLPNVVYGSLEKVVNELKFCSESFRCSTDSEHFLSDHVDLDDNVVTTLQENQQQISNHLIFLIENTDTKKLQMVQLTKTFKLRDCKYSLQDFFASSISEDDKLFNYFCSLFAVASLNGTEYLRDPSSKMKSPALDVDYRYQTAFKKWFKKKEQHTKGYASRSELSSFSNIILSPQQHRILSETTKTHLIITGQPGSGKTMLLIAKCEQMELRNDVEIIFLVYDKRKVLFGKFLKRSFNARLEATESKIKLVATNPKTLLSWLAELGNVVFLYIIFVTKTVGKRFFVGKLKMTFCRETENDVS